VNKLEIVPPEGGEHPPEDERAIQATALAVQRLAVQLCRAVQEMQKPARRIAERSVRDIEQRSGRPFSEGERRYLHTALALRLTGYVAAAAKVVDAEADALARRSPTWRAALEAVEGGRADG